VVEFEGPLYEIYD